MSYSSRIRFIRTKSVLTDDDISFKWIFAALFTYNSVWLSVTLSFNRGKFCGPMRNTLLFISLLQFYDLHFFFFGDIKYWLWYFSLLCYWSSKLHKIGWIKFVANNGITFMKMKDTKYPICQTICEFVTFTCADNNITVRNLRLFFEFYFCLCEKCKWRKMKTETMKKERPVPTHTLWCDM